MYSNALLFVHGVVSGNLVRVVESSICRVSLDLGHTPVVVQTARRSTLICFSIVVRKVALVVVCREDITTAGTPILIQRSSDFVISNNTNCFVVWLFGYGQKRVIRIPLSGSGS